MSRLLGVALGALTALSFAYAAEKSDWWQYKSFKGSYLIYSGDLGEERPPKQNDRKVSFMVKGPLAKEMFDSMYPDAKERCSDDKGYRERNKGNVSCTNDRDGYVCHFGFNLRNGESISGASC
jgi:hypothetical protein